MKPLTIPIIMFIVSILCLIYLIVPWAATHGPLSDTCIKLSEKGYFDAGDFVVHESCIEGEYEWADNCTMKWNPSVLPPFGLMKKYGAGSDVRCLIKYENTTTWGMGTTINYNKTCNRDIKTEDSVQFRRTCIIDIFPSMIWLIPQMFCYIGIFVSVAVYSYLFKKENGENETKLNNSSI